MSHAEPEMIFSWFDFRLLIERMYKVCAATFVQNLRIKHA